MLHERMTPRQDPPRSPAARPAPARARTGLWSAAMTTAEFREKYRIEQVGPRYSGPAHLAFTSALALAVIALALSRVRAPGWALLTVPATFLYANLIEYLGHKGPMHRPSRLLRLVYRRHTLEHHAFFTRAEMQV